jgi:hypothetical protein
MENPSKPDDLPTDVLEGAVLRGNEYAWTPESFPIALERAEAHGLACLGGQFQFRLNDATCEMYWLAADSKERIAGELWADYCRRSCSEVRENFDCVLSKTDFSKEASGWNLPPTATRNLVFVAYFVTEAELAGLESRKQALDTPAEGI